MKVDYTTLHNINIAAAKCRRCELYKNGHAAPFIGNDIKGILFGEAPGQEEIKMGTPFIGKAGQILWSEFSKYGLLRDNFLVINSCNCRPITRRVGGSIKNGKPTIEELEQCRALNNLYLRNCDVTYVMTLGNYPKWFFTNEIANISRDAGRIITWENRKILYNYHPAALLYNPSVREYFNIFIEKFSNLIK